MRRLVPLVVPLLWGTCAGAAAGGDPPPVADPPVADPPVADPPVADPPVADPPVADPPVADPPVKAEPAAPPRTKFVTPLAGTPYQDWAITNYVDVDPTWKGIEDARGGPYSYDFHDGIDFTLPNFAAMDRGVAVFAAADGVVIETDDGHPDRNAGDFKQLKARDRAG